MPNILTLDELWDGTSPVENAFESAQIADLPEGGRRYLSHAIAPGTRLASAVRLRMHGEIKLRDWLPFTAEQVIRQDRGFIWSATARMYGFPIRGSDCLLDGEGAMRWKLFGLIPVMTASGPDITRSAIGRFQIESIWLPSALYRPGVTWTESDPSRSYASFTTNGETTGLELVTSNTGQLRAASLPRWGQPDGEAFQCRTFGGIFDEERTFGGYTIPTRVRVGWDYGTNPDAWTGEFFRATITEAHYR
ncbi:MAG: hypothetical protein H7145_24825 [Akkermansiaceae bacterium]|nr:hypothetical protein [Armatimonadota bacterium]